MSKPQNRYREKANFRKGYLVSVIHIMITVIWKKAVSVQNVIGNRVNMSVINIDCFTMFWGDYFMIIRTPAEKNISNPMVSTVEVFFLKNSGKNWHYW